MLAWYAAPHCGTPARVEDSRWFLAPPVIQLRFQRLDFPNHKSSPFRSVLTTLLEVVVHAIRERQPLYSYRLHYAG